MNKKKLSPEMQLRINALQARSPVYTARAAMTIYALGIGTGVSLVWFILELIT